MAKFHRDSIMDAAERLFLEKGIEKTTMDDIAREADYSKATIYVYFKNKDEVYNRIVYRSIKLLLERIMKALSDSKDLLGRYCGICNELARYSEEYPLYFESVTGRINVDIELKETPQVFRDIYETGEEIVGEIEDFILEAISKGAIRADIQIKQVSFLFWAGITGIIRMAGQKEAYIRKTMGISKDEFMQFGFRSLLRTILTEKEAQEWQI